MVKTTLLSPVQALSTGRDIFLKNWKPVVKLALVLLGVNFLVAMVNGLFGVDSGLLGSLLNLAGNLLNLYLGYGFFKAMIMIYDHKEVDIQTLAQPINDASRYILGTLILSLIVLFGSLFFLIPGLYFLSKYFFVPALLADTNKGIGEAFAASAKMTDGHKMDIFVYILLTVIATMIGLLAFIVGAMAVSWMAMFGMIALYRGLVAKAN